MAKFDLNSLFATIAFFISVALFMNDILSFFEFLKFLLIVEGVVFLSGAFSYSKEIREDDNTFKNLTSDLPAQFNQMRYIFGLLFFFVGSFIENLQY